MTGNSEHMQKDWPGPDDAPDLSEAYWQAKLDAAPVRRGRPVSDNPKISTTLRLNAEIVDHFRAGVPGWQSRINAALKDWMSRR